MNSRTAAMALVILSTSTVIGAPIDLTINPALSTIDLTITVDVSVASDSDSGSSTLSGSIEIELDDAGNPTEISLIDLEVIIDQTMDFNWSFGFFGSADATMTNGYVLYATPGIPTGPVPVNAESFVFPEVLVDFGGLINVNYDIFLVGSGSEFIDMGDQGSFVTSFSGDVVVNGETITLSTTLPLDTTQPLVDSNGNQLGTVIVSGTATIVAEGTVPSCPADMNGDENLNFFDVSAFLSAFSASDPSADFTADGQFNFFDVSAFLTAFSAGCQ